LGAEHPQNYLSNMSIYIDSAIESEVRAALGYGWVSGVTTNPVLLAKATEPPEIILRKLAATSAAQIFYQLTSSNPESMLTEAHQAREILSYKLVVKIPPTPQGFQFVARYSREMAFCLTAIFSAAQAVVAAEANARYIAVYVNRATHLLGDGLRLVQDIAETLSGYSTEIIAASLKSPVEASSAVRAGAHHLTVPFSVLQQLTHHECSEEIITEFQTKGVGII
jgi:transaldolase